jgi:hypothetical protein
MKEIQIQEILLNLILKHFKRHRFQNLKHF